MIIRIIRDKRANSTSLPWTLLAENNSKVVPQCSAGVETKRIRTFQYVKGTTATIVEFSTSLNCFVPLPHSRPYQLLSIGHFAIPIPFLCRFVTLSPPVIHAKQLEVEFVLQWGEKDSKNFKETQFGHFAFNWKHVDKVLFVKWSVTLTLVLTLSPKFLGGFYSNLLIRDSRF